MVMQDRLRARKDRTRIDHSFEHEGKTFRCHIWYGGGRWNCRVSSDAFKARSGITLCDLGLGVADVDLLIYKICR